MTSFSGEFLQQSRRSDAYGENDDERHERRSDSLLTAVSASGGVSAGDARRDAAAGTTLTLQAT